MSRRTRSAFSTVLAAATLAAGAARADGPGAAPIIGGSAASRCQWPSVVMLFDGHFLCSGTLVHPRIVL
ncbi:MAG TPA: hypothetical protein VKB80_20855, partial [Kofleriaceae bacterium]|nr:hypothetical protein [Kofleriaceae bacterium]